jgi:hypothetical protein
MQPRAEAAIATAGCLDNASSINFDLIARASTSPTAVALAARLAGSCA